jgi:hypothetical protein
LAKGATYHPFAVIVAMEVAVVLCFDSESNVRVGSVSLGIYDGLLIFHETTNVGRGKWAILSRIGEASGYGGLKRIKSIIVETVQECYAGEKVAVNFPHIECTAYDVTNFSSCGREWLGQGAVYG